MSRIGWLPFLRPLGPLRPVGGGRHCYQVVVKGEVVGIVLFLLRSPRPSAGPVSIGQGDHVIDVQVPRDCDGGPSVGSQPPTVVDSA